MLASLSNARGRSSRPWRQQDAEVPSFGLKVRPNPKRRIGDRERQDALTFSVSLFLSFVVPRCFPSLFAQRTLSLLSLSLYLSMSVSLSMSLCLSLCLSLSLSVSLPLSLSLSLSVSLSLCLSVPHSLLAVVASPFLSVFLVFVL